MNEITQKKVPFYPFLSFLILISFISFINILGRVIFSPLTPSICAEMDLGHADTGNLFLVLSLGFALTLFVSQFISSIISHRMTIIISVLSMGLALILTAFSHGFFFFRISLFIVGMGSGLFIPSAVAMLREGVDNSHLGKAFGIFATAQSFAFILAPVIIQYFMQFTTWRGILNWFGLITVIFSFILFLFYKDGDSKGKAINFSFIRDVFSWPSFWILLALHCLINGLNIGIYNMAPDYFARHNLLEKEDVNHLMIIARTISIITAILGGVIADKLGLKRAIVICLVLCGVITGMMGPIQPSSALLLFCIQSPIATCLMPLIHFAIAIITPPEKNAAIVSIIAPFGFMVGAGIIPQILGFFGEFNIYEQGFVLFGILAIIGGVVFNLRSVYRHVENRQLESMES